MRARLVMTALAAALVAGCQGIAAPMPTTSEDPMASAPPITLGLDAQSLSTLLSAELAGQRGDFSRAAQDYLAMSERYDSAPLAERATLAARYINDPQLLTRTAERWQKLAPEAEAPARLLANLAMERGDWEGSLEQRLSLAARGDQGELTSFVEAAIDQGAPLPLLLKPLQAFLIDHPSHADAILAVALLEAATGGVESAQQRLIHLAQARPEWPPLWLARSHIALEHGQFRDAQNFSQQGLELAPNDSRFALLLAQSQLRLGELEAAESRLNELVAKHPDSQQLHLALAQLYLEEGYPAPARRLLLPLIEDDPSPPLAHILLGMIAEQGGEIDNALLYYRQVPPGDGFIEARLRAARMLINAERLKDARTFLRIEQLRHDETYSELITLEIELLEEQGLTSAANQRLDREIANQPDDTQLRFLRAMRLYDRGDLKGMERDLRRIIAQQPNNAMALNALGYTLVDVTDRTEEGFELIQRAHELEPESPAILDSLGWAYHKLGNHRRALPYLERAYAGQPDQEIAAHRAEVLWHMKRHEEARAVVADATTRFADHPLIEALIERIPALSPTPGKVISP